MADILSSDGDIAACAGVAGAVMEEPDDAIPPGQKSPPSPEEAPELPKEDAKQVCSPTVDGLMKAPQVQSSNISLVMLFVRFVV